MALVTTRTNNIMTITTHFSKIFSILEPLPFLTIQAIIGVGIIDRIEIKDIIPKIIRPSLKALSMFVDIVKKPITDTMISTMKQNFTTLSSIVCPLSFLFYPFVSSGYCSVIDLKKIASTSPFVHPW